MLSRVEDRSFDVFASLLTASHLITEDEVPLLLAGHARGLGVSDIGLYLADYDQRFLVPVPMPGGPDRSEAAIDGTLAGWCFRTLSVREVPHEGGSRRLWVPMVDGTERLGVLELVIESSQGAIDDEVVESLAAIAAELVMTKRGYGDLFEGVRRRRPMSLAAEMLWQLLPPLTFGTKNVVITAGVAPPYDVGGDAFDYAVNEDTAHIAVFDAMGHGLAAGVMASIAVAAYRNSRRRQLDLVATVGVIDEAIRTHVGGSKYVTGVLAELDLASGRLRWCIAGHPRPMILRRGRIVRTLEAGAHVPFGLGAAPGIGQESLEPDDRVLFYTDGITEARAESGELFGLDRFADLVSRASSEEMPAPETMRRLMHAILDHQVGDLRDDATALIVQWPGHGVEQLTIGADDD